MSGLSNDELNDALRTLFAGALGASKSEEGPSKPYMRSTMRLRSYDEDDHYRDDDPESVCDPDTPEDNSLGALVRSLSTVASGLLSSRKLDDIPVGSSAVLASNSDVHVVAVPSQVTKEEATTDYLRVALQMQERFGVSVTYVGKSDPDYANVSQAAVDSDAVVFKVAFDHDDSKDEKQHRYAISHLSSKRKVTRVETQFTPEEVVEYGSLFHKIANSIVSVIDDEETKSDKSTHATEREQ